MKQRDGHGHHFIYFNHYKDRNDVDFSPYELVKVTSVEIRSEYFTMSASGVTHIYSNGTTEAVSLDQWTRESVEYEASRKLNFFSKFYFWKPFRIWKRFGMRRYQEFTPSIDHHVRIFL
jgi:hypothetical protein